MGGPGMLAARVAVVVCAVVGTLSAAPLAHAGFPGGNGMLAFGHHLPGVDNSVFQMRINADGTGEGPLLGPFEPEVRFTLAADWSPSGNQVVYERRREWGGAIYRANADGTGETRLSPPGVASHNAVWSPDGLKVAYRRYSTGNAAEATLWVMNADGSGQSQIIPEGINSGECSAWLATMDWGATGRIAFVAACEAILPEGGWRIWTVAGNGQDLRAVSAVPTMLAYQTSDLDWSPDGKKIAFSAYEESVSGYTVGECGTAALPYDIYVADVDQNTNTNITNTSGWVGPHELAPAWSPDGQQIAFASSTYTCTGTTTIYSRQPIFRMPAAGGVATRVTDPQPRTFLGTDDTTIVTLDTADQTPDWQPCVPGTTSGCVSISPPRNTAPPTIVGSSRIGATLTCDPGTWTGSSSLAYRWLRSGTEIPGATAPTYVVGADDVYLGLTCEVTGTGPGGTTTAASAVRNIDPDASTSPGTANPPGGAPGATSQARRPALPQGSPAAAAKVIALPSTRTCASRRAFPIRLRVPRGERVARAVVRVQGRSALTVTRRLNAPIVLKGLPKGRWTIRVDVTTSRRTLRLTRTYRTCVPRPKRPSAR